jgi:hypothetical protein
MLNFAHKIKRRQIEQQTFEGFDIEAWLPKITFFPAEMRTQYGH